MGEARLHLYNCVTRGNVLRSMPPVAHTQLVPNIFTFRIAHEWNLLLLKIIASPFFYLRKG